VREERASAAVVALAPSGHKHHGCQGPPRLGTKAELRSFKIRFLNSSQHPELRSDLFHLVTSRMRPERSCSLRTGHPCRGARRQSLAAQLQLAIGFHGFESQNGHTIIQSRLQHDKPSFPSLPSTLVTIEDLQPNFTASKCSQHLIFAYPASTARIPSFVPLQFGTLHCSLLPAPSPDGMRTAKSRYPCDSRTKRLTVWADG
jgi:hypothetical protein